MNQLCVSLIIFVYCLRVVDKSESRRKCARGFEAEDGDGLLEKKSIRLSFTSIGGGLIRIAVRWMYVF